MILEYSDIQSNIEELKKHDFKVKRQFYKWKHYSNSYPK